MFKERIDVLLAFSLGNTWEVSIGSSMLASLIKGLFLRNLRFIIFVTVDQQKRA